VTPQALLEGTPEDGAEARAERRVLDWALHHPINARRLREDPLRAPVEIAWQVADALRTDAAVAQAEEIEAGLSEVEAEDPELATAAELRRQQALRLERLAAARQEPIRGPSRRSPLRTPAARLHGRSGRQSRQRRPRAAAGSSSRRSRNVDRSDDPEPPAAACPGCGEQFTPASTRQTYCTKPCATAARQRRWYDRHVTKPERPRPEARTITPATPTALRELVNEKAARRLQLRCELPDANGNRTQLLEELHTLDAEVDHAWDDIRIAEAVAR